MKVAVGLLLALLVVACTGAGALLLYGRSQLEQTAIEGISPSKGRTITLEDGGSIEIMNVLLVGVDNPGDLTEAERARVAPDERSGRRPDVLMLAQLEVGGKGGAILSVPRDLRVELCDGSVDKINASFAVASRAGTDPESCLVQTVTSVTGIEVDHYVEVDFGGFVRVMQALGGVTMYLEEPMIDRKAHLDIPAGCITLTPEEALGFVRSRGYDDDFGRMARQQRFIREAVDEARRVGVVANPARLFALVDRASKAVRTDDGLGLTRMRDFALGLRNLSSSSLVAHVVPSEPATMNGVSYVLADEVAAEALYASFRDGSVLGEVASGEPVPPPPTTEPAIDDDLEPADVAAIVVLNASGESGLAGRTAEMLEASGFRIARVDNAPARQATTEVVHGTGLEAQGRVVADALEDVQIRHESGGAPLTLVIGEDMDVATIEGFEQARARAAAGDGDDGEASAEFAGGAGDPQDGEEAVAAGDRQDGDARGPAGTGQDRAFRGADRPDDVDC